MTSVGDRAHRVRACMSRPWNLNKPVRQNGATQSPRAPCSRASIPDLLLGRRHERPGARLPSGDPS
jgi:hypothetical protein